MKFQRFYEHELHMSPFFDNFSDNRKRPQIPASHLGRSTIYMPALKTQSILQLDQISRTQQVRDIIGTQRYMVASDTTLQRVMPQFDFQPINDTIKAVYSQIVARGMSKFCLSTGKRLRIAAVDGSGFGRHFASVVAIVGHGGTFPLDCHVSKIYGKELLCSRATLSRLTDTLGKSWCDILVADGLYPTKTDFVFAIQNLGCHLLVKTSEKTLSVIQDANAMLASDNPDVKTDTGFDAKRNIHYEAKSISGLIWQNIPYPLTVTRVVETKPNSKSGKIVTEEFFAITTDTNLLPNEVREIAHARWFIENNVFKRLNALINSKRVYTKNLATISTLLPLWLIGLSLLQIFVLYFQKLNWQLAYGKMHISFLFLVRQINQSLFLPLPHSIFECQVFT